MVIRFNMKIVSDKISLAEIIEIVNKLIAS